MTAPSALNPQTGLQPGLASSSRRCPGRGAFSSPGPGAVGAEAECGSAFPARGTAGPRGLLFCGKNWPGCERGSRGDCLYLTYKQMPSGMRALFI